MTGKDHGSWSGWKAACRLHIQVTRAGLPADHTIIVGIHCSESILHSTFRLQRQNKTRRLFKDCPKSWLKLPILAEISYFSQCVSVWLPLFLPQQSAEAILWRFVQRNPVELSVNQGQSCGEIMIFSFLVYSSRSRNCLQNFLPDWAGNYVQRVFTAGSPFFTYLNQSNP